MPSNTLLNLTTPCGWEIFEKISTKQHSGGNFCARYKVRNESGEVAFLKAMDFTRAFGSHDPMVAINNITSEYLFEREILYYCKEMNLSKVVIPKEAGQITNPLHPTPLNNVYYIIFELADSDMRQSFIDSLNINWHAFFKAMQHICMGLEQLHFAGIAHQDIKPSNILHFKQMESKIADLGRVVDAGGRSPYLSLRFPGDQTYAPIEIKCGVSYKSFQDRYLTDIYSVGSLIYQSIMGVGLTPSLSGEALLLHSGIFSVSYDDALPTFLTAYSTLLARFYAECCNLIKDDDIALEVVNVVKEMCHPDYNKRGAPKVKSRPYKINMRRYSSKMANIQVMLKVKGG